MIPNFLISHFFAKKHIDYWLYTHENNIVTNYLVFLTRFYILKSIKNLKIKSGS